MPDSVLASPLFESAPFAIALTKLPEGTIVDVNPAFLALFECTREDAIGKTSVELGLADRESRAQVGAELERRGFVRDFHCERRTRTGAARYLSLNLDPLTLDGESCCVTTIEDVTDRRRAEIELRESTALLRAIAERSPDAIFAKDLTGRIRFANPATLALIGKPLDQVIGRTDVEMLDDKEAARRVMETDRRIMDAGVPVELEEIVPYPDGSERVWLSHKTPYRDQEGRVIGLLGISRDITGRKRAELEQRHLAEQRQLALDAAAMGWWRIDLRSRVESWDERYAEIFGLTGSERHLDRRLEHVHPDDAPTLLAKVDAARDPRHSGQFEAEYRIARGGDGAVRWIETHGTAIFDGTGEARRAVALVGTVRDITDRKREQQALLEAYAQLEDVDRRKDEFLALMSHELRNPLAPMRYALPLLGAQALDAGGARAVAVLDRQLSHLTRLVDDLLDVGRVNSGKIELRREQVALGTILTTATEAASPAIVAARHTLHIDTPDEPVWLYADASRLAQVVSNLLDNAARYTPDGGEITLQVTVEHDEAIIRVRDTGVGLGPDALPHVFEMFWRAARPGDTQGGLGIGLALAKLLVELHGGTIEAHSGGAGQGAEFVARVPVERRGDIAARAGEAAPTADRRLKVLAVDDNADLVEMLSMVIEQAGHDVRKALDGRTAISAALSYRPDVILLDLGLPGMSGLDVARELRRHPETARARIVALTGWGQPDDIRRTREAGFDAHLTKPTDPADLERLLAQFSAEVL